MFYAYYENHYAEYEPAEGGYYVSCSEITECVECYSLEEALEVLTEMRNDAEKTYELYAHDDTIGFRNLGTEENPETVLLMPWYQYDYHGYVGDGFTIGIDVEKPQDKPYVGYC